MDAHIHTPVCLLVRSSVYRHRRMCYYVAITFVLRVVPFLLVDDRVESNGGLSRLAVPNNKLALATANGDHGIYRFDPRLHGLSDGFSRNYAWGFDRHTLALDICQWPLENEEKTPGLYYLSVDWISKSIDNPSQETLAARNIDNVSRASDNVSLSYQTVVSKYDNANIVRLQIQSHALDARRKLDHFFGLDIFQPINACNAIANRQNSARL